MNDMADGSMEALLAGYVAGSVPEPVRVMLDAHLELSKSNHDYVDALENMAGDVLEALEPRELKNQAHVLDSIFDADLGDDSAISLRSIRPQALPEGSDIPKSLLDFVGGELGTLPWKTVLPGIRKVDFETVDGVTPTLLWIRAGNAMPSHTHDGKEMTLVLQGGFSDSDGHWVRGDVAIADEDVDHKPVADPGEDCICFALVEKPVRLTGPIGRIVQSFIRH